MLPALPWFAHILYPGVVMGRPRKFDTDAVLAAARSMFWSRGFAGTSLDDLSRATSVSKSSLYAAFGDKSALFDFVLGRYHAGLLERSRHQLLAAGPARAAIRAWLVGFLPFCSEEGGRDGCLSANTSIEVARLDPHVAVQIDEFRAATMALLSAAIRRGIADGDISRSLGPEAAARAILTAQIGLMLVARAQPGAAETLQTMDLILDGVLASS
jgi:TetR/AcrR family transcriptional repressor of nem operon